jgi:hypothetical protein
MVPDVAIKILERTEHGIYADDLFSLISYLPASE